MDTYQKLAFVANETHFESDGDLSPSTTSVQLTQGTMLNFCGGLSLLRNPNPQSRSLLPKDLGIPIHMAAAPGGKRIPLLKSMLTTACEMGCHYCTFRAGRNYRRVTFQPEELASVFMEVYQKGLVQGLFLSTGILAGGANTQNRILDTAELLRNRHKYRSYMHIKIMPGVEKGQVLRAMQLGDRVSINLEAPNAERLAVLAPQKQFVDQLITPFRWIDEIRSRMDPLSAWDGRWPSSTTQFVVGAVGESDLELLSTVQYLSRSTGFARAYFEAFTPVPNTPLIRLLQRITIFKWLLKRRLTLYPSVSIDSEAFSLPIKRRRKMTYRDDAVLGSIHDRLQRTYVELQVAIRAGGFSREVIAALVKARIGIVDVQRDLYADLDKAYPTAPDAPVEPSTP